MLDKFTCWFQIGDNLETLWSLACIFVIMFCIAACIAGMAGMRAQTVVGKQKSLNCRKENLWNSSYLLWPSRGRMSGVMAAGAGRGVGRPGIEESELKLFHQHQEVYFTCFKFLSDLQQFGVIALVWNSYLDEIERFWIKI